MAYACVRALINAVGLDCHQRDCAHLMLGIATAVVCFLVGVVTGGFISALTYGRETLNSATTYVDELDGCDD